VEGNGLVLENFNYEANYLRGKIRSMRGERLELLGIADPTTNGSDQDDGGEVAAREESRGDNNNHMTCRLDRCS